MNSFDADELVEQQAIAPMHPGIYLAARILKEHVLEPPLTYEQVRNICSARGIPVIPKPELEGQDAVCCCHPEYGVVIFIRRPDAFVLAHELYHAITGENSQRGILYCMHWFSEPPEEDAANRFAETLAVSPGYRWDWDTPGPEEFWEPGE